MRATTCLLVLIMLGLVAAAGCAPSPGEGGSPDRAAGKVPAGPPTREQLANAVIHGIYKKPVQLENGVFEGEPFDPDGASRQRVQLLDPVRTADMDGEPGEEAVMLLSESSGASGTFLYLAVVGMKDGAPVNLGTAGVGDRVQVRTFVAEEGRIRLDLVEAGPGDALCCPGQLSSRTWALREGKLGRIAASIEGNLGFAVPAGREWVLKDLDLEEPAPRAAEITLVVEETGRIAGSSGCNRYFGALAPGESPGEVTLGPVGATRMACPEEVMALEQAYLERLRGVFKYGFLLEDLVLTWKVNDRHGTLRFEARPLPSE